MLDLLKPKNINDPKVRLGNWSDGGYVVSDKALHTCTALFTYGVGHNITYEEDFIRKYNKPVYMFDHTMKKSNSQYGRLNYFNEGLGFEDGCGDVLDHYKRLNIQDDIFIKIDVEGAEYDYFLKIDIKRLASITSGLCIEFHQLSNPVTRSMFINLLEMFEKYFTLVHVHGNNYGSLFSYKGYYIPDVLELSYINKKLVDFEEFDRSKYPTDLDAANDPGKPDYILKFINS